MSGHPSLMWERREKHLFNNKLEYLQLCFNICSCTCHPFFILLFLEPLKHIRTTRVVFTCIFSLFPRRLYSELQQQRSLVLEQVSVAPARHYCICSLWNTHLTGFMWGNATFSNRLDHLEYFRTGFVFPDVWNSLEAGTRKTKKGNRGKGHGHFLRI